jgi:hypothetical protein
VRGWDPPHFDPHLTISNYTHSTLSLIYSRLVRHKAGPEVQPGTFPLEPDLAERWEAPDDTTYIFYLRPGVKWHNKRPVNGRELVAEDIKFTYDRFLTEKGNANRYMLDTVDRIEVVDRYTVKFLLKEPYVWFANALAYPWSTWVIAPEVVQQFGDLKKPQTAIGTGPFMLERYEPNVKSVFKRHPEYFLEESRERLDGTITGLRVGVVRKQLDTDLVQPEVRAAVLRALDVLRDLGATVEDVSIPLAAHAGTISGGLRVEAPRRYRTLLQSRLQEISHDNRIGYLTGALLPAQAYYKAQQLRVLLRQQVLQALGQVDVLVQPTAGRVAQQVEPDPIIDSKTKTNRLAWLLTTTYSLANVPALSLPCGFQALQGGPALPIGLQIAGKPFAEVTVFKVAHVYEQQTPWHHQRPPL